MITSVINPKGTSRVGGFQRVCEYIFIIRIRSSAAITFGQRMLDDEKIHLSQGTKPLDGNFLREVPLTMVGDKKLEIYSIQ